jgi:hypothetical protein
LTTPYHYDPADYTAYFDDYRIVSIPVDGPEIVVEQGVDLTSGAAGVDFGTGLVGASSQRTFTIRNFGSENLTGVITTIDGPNAADFTITASPAGTINSLGSTTFTVTFSPAAAGARTASLHITSNDADENPFHIALFGAGAVTPAEIAQQAYLKASNTGSGDFFGTCVAVDGDTVVIGAFGERSNATGVNGNQANNSAQGSGAAYVFTGLGPSTLEPEFRILSIEREINGTTRLIANALAGYNYTLQASENLNDWTDLTTQSATANQIQFTDAPTNSPAMRLYRVKQN